MIQEIQADHAKILLVPTRPNPSSYRYYSAATLEQIARNEAILYRLAGEHHLEIAPFPAGVISKKNWADGIHLRPEGAREKAEYLAPYIRRMLWSYETH